MKLNKSSHIYGLFQSFMQGKRLRIFTFLICSWQLAMAQGDTSPDFMRSMGKIYVVAAVCLIILVTVLVYLVALDRKISRLEKRQKNE